MTLRVMVSRHSAFYSPLLAAVRLFEARGNTVEFGVLKAGQRSAEMIARGEIDVFQSAVSSSWRPMERGQSPLPVHFAQINRRDGFFLVSRRPEPDFEWKHLKGRWLLADHAFQPMAMLRYAVRANGAGWDRIEVIDAGDPDEMSRAFRAGQGDYVHLQSPGAHALEREGVGYVVRSVGASMPEVAFSSLCCARAFLETEACREFIGAFREAREWVRSAPTESAAARIAGFFPGVSPDAIAMAIEAYQAVGCWGGDIAIPRELYEQALTVFETGGLIAARHPYEAVCAEPL